MACARFGSAWFIWHWFTADYGAGGRLSVAPERLSFWTGIEPFIARGGAPEFVDVVHLDQVLKVLLAAMADLTMNPTQELAFIRHAVEQFLGLMY